MRFGGDNIGAYGGYRSGVDQANVAITGGTISGVSIASPTITGAALFADGTTGAPSISFTSTNNTGFLTASSSTVSLSAGNSDLWTSTSTATRYTSTKGLGWSSGASQSVAQDTMMWRASANSILFNGSTTAATTTSRTEGQKAITAFTEATPKTIATITIPNAAHSASVRVRITGSVGAGGDIGANEASATNEYDITIVRTAGVNAVATISTAYGAAAANVAGATTITAVLTLEAVSGAVGATNTIGILGTLTTAGGSSDNHTAVITWSLLNANATGITIA